MISREQDGSIFYWKNRPGNRRSTRYLEDSLVQCLLPFFTTGIGKGIVMHLTQLGAKIVAMDVSENHLVELPKEVNLNAVHRLR